MTLITLLLQILLTIPLSIILKIIDKKTSNIIKLIIPTVYIIIISALIPYIKTNIFLITVFEIFMRSFYVTNISKEETIKTNTMFIIESIISIFISLLTYNYFISKVDTVIPNPEDIKPFLWFTILILICYIYKALTKEKEIKKEKQTMIIKNENIIMDYAKYKSRYFLIINSENKIVNDLTYAIMIYNVKKTNPVNRKITEYKGIITRKEVPYGIMQIKSYNHLSDEDSIRETIKQLEEKYNKTDKKLDSILEDYDESTRQTIISIYAIIVDFQKK